MRLLLLVAVQCAFAQNALSLLQTSVQLSKRPHLSAARHAAPEARVSLLQQVPQQIPPMFQNPPHQAPPSPAALSLHQGMPMPEGTLSPPGAPSAATSVEPATLSASEPPVNATDVVGHVNGEAASDVRFAPTVKGCHEGEGGCKSMCRWLMLTEQDFEKDDDNDPGTSGCHLLTFTLKTAGYVPLELRTPELGGNAAQGAMDCAAGVMRLNALEHAVPAYVARLTHCLSEMPRSGAVQYQVVLKLLHREVEDWKEEAELRATISRARRSILGAIEEGRVAYEKKLGIREAITALAAALDQAEALEGHHLSGDIRVARQTLQKLLPIPAVQVELHQAMEGARKLMQAEANHELKADELQALYSSMAQLNISIEDAEELELRDPLPEAKQLLEELSNSYRRMKAWSGVLAQANLSWSTKQQLANAAYELQSAMAWAETHVPSQSVSSAKDLLEHLGEAMLVLEKLKDSTAEGEHLLAGREDSLRKLNAATEHLRSSLKAAHEMGLIRHDVFLPAVRTYDQLLYMQEAREQLKSASFWAGMAVESGRKDLDVTLQEESIEQMEPSIAWAKEVGLEHGLHRAVALVTELRDMEYAKGNMSEALILGNATREAKVGESRAIEELYSAAKENERLNISAGMEEAVALVKLLKRREEVKQHVTEMRAIAKHALTSGKDVETSINILANLVEEAKQVGLDEKAAVAESILHGLQAYKDAEEQQEEDKENAETARMEVKNNLTASSNSSAVVEELLGDFHRTGQRIVKLGPVKGAKDDGDDDYAEHISILEKAIHWERSHFEIDPEHEVLLEELKAKEHCLARLGTAIQVAEASFESKTSVESSIRELNTELVSCQALGVTASVDVALRLQQQLQRIEPAKEELAAAILEARSAEATESHIEFAVRRLKAAMDECEDLKLTEGLEEGKGLLGTIQAMEHAHVALKAAIVQGELALDKEEATDAAFHELVAAVTKAKEVGLSKDFPIAFSLLHELQKSNNAAETVEKAMTPEDPEKFVKEALKEERRLGRQVEQDKKKEEEVIASADKDAIAEFPFGNNHEEEASDEDHAASLAFGKGADKKDKTKGVDEESTFPLSEAQPNTKADLKEAKEVEEHEEVEQKGSGGADEDVVAEFPFGIHANGDNSDKNDASWEDMERHDEMHAADKKQESEFPFSNSEANKKEHSEKAKEGEEHKEVEEKETEHEGADEGGSDENSNSWYFDEEAKEDSEDANKGEEHKEAEEKETEDQGADEGGSDENANSWYFGEETKEDSEEAKGVEEHTKVEEKETEDQAADEEETKHDSEESKDREEHTEAEDEETEHKGADEGSRDEDADSWYFDEETEEHDETKEADQQELAVAFAHAKSSKKSDSEEANEAEEHKEAEEKDLMGEKNEDAFKSEKERAYSLKEDTKEEALEENQEEDKHEEEKEDEAQKDQDDEHEENKKREHLVEDLSEEEEDVDEEDKEEEEEQKGDHQTHETEKEQDARDAKFHLSSNTTKDDTMENNDVKDPFTIKGLLRKIVRSG